MSGAKACNIRLTNVTKPATITIYAGSLTVSGITFLRSEITIFEHTSTNVVESPIPTPFAAIVVMASVGHIPRSITIFGFSFMSPLVNSFQLLIRLYLLIHHRVCLYGKIYGFCHTL